MQSVRGNECGAGAPNLCLVLDELAEARARSATRNGHYDEAVARMEHVCGGGSGYSGAVGRCARWSVGDAVWRVGQPAQLGERRGGASELALCAHRRTIVAVAEGGAARGRRNRASNRVQARDM
eukprot:ctg_465.g179